MGDKEWEEMARTMRYEGGDGKDYGMIAMGKIVVERELKKAGHPDPRGTAFFVMHKNCNGKLHGKVGGVRRGKNS